MENVVAIAHLSKSYGDVRALQDISLNIPSGVVWGILGPNGSGKTTLMRIVCAITPRDSGSVKVLGMDPAEFPMKLKEVIGYVPEDPVLYESMTASEYLSFVASVRKIDPTTYEKRAEALFRALELKDYANEPIGSLSFGNRQKVSIASALIHDPQILVLDEALKGVDPRSSRVVKDLVHALAERGKTILFSTHVLEIAESTCQKISILYHGKVVEEGSLEEIRSREKGPGTNLEDIFLRLTSDDAIKSMGEDLAGILG
ncbi:MAG: ABC transporter ATP-binding protein [Thermoplasmata archaeon]